MAQPDEASKSNKNGTAQILHKLAEAYELNGNRELAAEIKSEAK